MPFLVKDVLIVDATVIIGLFILLSFQSISSSFIETESSEFKLEYDKALDEFHALDSLVANCNGENDMSDEEFEEYLTDLGIIETKKICSKWSVEYVELGYYLQNTERQGYQYGYLQQWDENGNIHTNEFYEYQPELHTTESEYLHKVATGPFYVNQMNLIM